MGIIVHSPFSGQPVKVRDQDAGRAVRDEEGRIFYVLPKSDGSGYYGAPTRAGGAKDEARALEYENKLARAQEISRAQVRAVHDATGRSRSGARGKLVILVLAVAVGALAYLFTLGPLAGRWKAPPWIDTPEGVRYQIVSTGGGRTAQAGNTVTVHYTGVLEATGETFETSRQREPFSFVLGQGKVIRGWDIGIAGMREGEKRTLVIPSQLAYGQRGTEGIPPGATLRFEVELLRVDP